LDVQQFSGAVDQVLATAAGAVDATNGNPQRFVEAMRPNVTSSQTLTGIALVERGGQTRVAARVGATPLLAGSMNDAFSSGRSATLIASRRDATGFALGFAAKVKADRAVFVQLVLPTHTGSGTRFALLVPASGHGRSDILFGNVTTIAGLTRWNGTVVIGGRTATLLVRADPAATSLAGISRSDATSPSPCCAPTTGRSTPPSNNSAESKPNCVHRKHACARSSETHPTRSRSTT
jgi:hypothetical protein